MAWRIEFAAPARKELDKLANNDVARIVNFLEDRVANHPSPRDLAKRLVGRAEYWRFRVGDYRIIVRFEDYRLVVLVVEIGHRSSIYKR